jgi:hypothetical protein
MAHFRDRANRADLLTFTPNEIIIQVSAVRPGVLTINQIADRDWRVGEGALVADVPLLMVDLSRTGEYRVRLRYVPSLLYRGLAASAATAIAGGVLLVMISRRLRAGPNP